MLKLSKFPFKTLKSKPNISDNKSTSLLLQSGFIRQTMAGVYTYTTLWLKVLRNIEKIVREEMDNAWAFETLMPALSPKELWDKTGRWDAIDVFFHVPAANNKEYGLNSTHEEVITPLLSEFINSYKDLPLCAYQIQNKFRNEKRAKSWLLRWREFLMKDAYSFHSSNEDFVEYYENMKSVYMKIFDRLGLWKDTYITLADWWTFTDKYSHEFQVVLPIWEDNIYICDKCNTSHNEEIVWDKFVCTSCKWVDYRVEKASEVWNIFPLETKFTKAFWVKYLDKDNKENIPLMWCYGIWVSRLMWVIAEYFMSEKWILWPESIAPATHYIIIIWEENIGKAESLAKQIESDGGSVIVDDRMWKKLWFWQKALDCELFGIPNRIVVSPKTLEKWGYELKERDKEDMIVET